MKKEFCDAAKTIKMVIANKNALQTKLYKQSFSDIIKTLALYVLII